MNLNFIKHSPFIESLSLSTKLLKPGLVFYGHGVTQKIIEPDVQKVQLEYADFVGTIELMEKLNYRFISMEKLQEITLSKTNLPYPWVHLTFDDGYKNNLTEIYPYLKSKNIPFTIFVSINHIINNIRFDTDRMAVAVKHTKKEQALSDLVKSLNIDYSNRSTLIDPILLKHKYLPTKEKTEVLEKICNLLDNKEWEFYNSKYQAEEVLTIDELKQLASDPLVHIGSHGCNHYIQTTLSESERMFELEHSKELLNQILGKTPSSFGYQNGSKKDFSVETIASCAKANYSFCFTTLKKKWSPGTSPMLIPRLPFTETYIPFALLKSPFI